MLVRSSKLTLYLFSFAKKSFSLNFFPVDVVGHRVLEVRQETRSLARGEGARISASPSTSFCNLVPEELDLVPGLIFSTLREREIFM